VASLQGGVITRAQLSATGLGRGAIDHRAATGRLYQVHRGVYAVGRPALESLGREWAAVLSLAGHGVLSHATAAALWGLTDQRPAEVVATVVGRDVRPRSGLRTHRTAELDRADIRNRHGLPLTGPSRTIVDLAGETDLADLENLFAEATIRRLTSERELRRAAERAPHGKPGIAAVRALFEMDGDPARLRSKAERRLLALIRAAQLPAPIVNGSFHGFEVDLRWPAQRLAIEIDGARFHDHRIAFERDRRRDQILVASGYRVMRVTWRQLEREPLAVIARIAAALQLAAA